MAAICQFHQYGHCKFSNSCDKTHTIMTCDSLPCQDNKCAKRHLRICKFFAMYGCCRFAERCSFLHCGLRERDHTASAALQASTLEVSELREEVKNLRIEINRLRKGTDARLSDAYVN